MRKIEQNMLKAIKGMTNFHLDNTSVAKMEVTDKLVRMEVRLHSNVIATLYFRSAPITSEIKISSCGWQTATTKSRLHVLLAYFTDYSLYQHKHVWYLHNRVTQEVSEFEDDTILPITKR